MNRLRFALVALTLCACDIPIERDRGPGPTVLGTDPADGDVGVDRAAPFRVFFDRQIYPRDVHRGRIRVQSGTRSAFLSPWFDPVERVLWADNLGGALEPTTRYRLWVEGIRDLELTPMAGRHRITFETGPDADGGAVPESVGFDRVQPIFAGCARDTCHGEARPALGLDLSSGEAIARTAIGVAAEQTRVGTQGEGPYHGAATLDGLAIVDVVGGVGRPSRSYLMYKVLGDPHAAGDVMPPAGSLSSADLSALSLWIHAGAPTE